MERDAAVLNKRPKRGKEKKDRVPDWALDHFKECLLSFQTTAHMVEICEHGISDLQSLPARIKLLSDIEDYQVKYKTGKQTKTVCDEQIVNAERAAQLAASELEKDFPVLHSFAVVALWGLLEHFAKGLVALWIRHRRDAMACQQMQRIRVKIGDFLQMPKADQGDFLVEMLEQEVSGPLRRGANRFQSLLEPFGLAVPLSESCTKNLFEFQQIRNAIAHRNGRADRRLRADCPWLKLKLNQQVLISREMLSRYQNASVEFLVVTLHHVGDMYGADLRTVKA